jgi:hypothetical protein
MADESITCPACKRVSYNPMDIDLRYCGACHKFHDDMMNKCDILEATHVRYKGKVHHIASKWGISVSERLAKHSQGGFGCITDTGERVSMWEAEAYYCQPKEEPLMSTWTIYYSPRDFPDKFVVRRHDIFRSKKEPEASSEFYVADSLEEIRKRIPFGLACLTRSEGDKLSVVETWI